MSLQKYNPPFERGRKQVCLQKFEMILKTLSSLFIMLTPTNPLVRIAANN